MPPLGPHAALGPSGLWPSALRRHVALGAASFPLFLGQGCNFVPLLGLECLCGLHVVDNDRSSVRDGVITAAVGNTSTSDCPANATKVRNADKLPISTVDGTRGETL